MNSLIPLIEAWLEEQDFAVSVLANRIDGVKKTGFLSSDKVTIFLEDYLGLCSVRLQGHTDTCAHLTEYLKSLPPKGAKSIPCPYCRTLVSIEEKKCRNCGAYLKG
jgi:hypothetical protein